MEEHILLIKNELSEIAKVVDTVDSIAEKWDLPIKIAFNLNLAIEELITNTISYGYEDENAHEIEITFTKTNKNLTVVLSDDAKRFNPLENEATPDLEASLDEKVIGGLGIFFVKKITCFYLFRREKV